MALYYRQSGEGPPLLLIHGLFGSLENLGGLARELAADFCVYSIDLPNHGRSAHTQESSLSDMAAAVKTWLDQKNLTRVSIVGHSLGGKVGMELALQFPELVSMLAVMDIAPVTYPPHHSDVFAGLLALDPSKVKTRSQADDELKARVPESAIRSFLLKNLVKGPQGYSWRMNLPLLHRDYERLIAGNCEGVFDKPTLFLKGGRSSYIQPQHKEAIMARFPAATLKVVAETGHWLHVEKSALVVRLLRRFLIAG